MDYTKLCLISMILCLTGCAICPEQVQTITQHCTQRPLPQCWSARGTVSISDGKEKHSGRMIWKQDHQKLHLILLGPLGLPYGSMTQTEQGFNWSQGSKKLTDVNMNPLIYNATGLNLPFDEAYHWILNNAHQKDSFIGKNSKIIVTKKVCVNGTILPKIIHISHEKFNAVIVITHWNL
jgi:outer membrane biogenesis lipoprotein LolB